MKYLDNSQIDQEEREARQWIDVREMPEWKRISAVAKCRIEYLHNRRIGNFGQQNYSPIFKMCAKPKT